MGSSSIGRKFGYLCGYKDIFDNLKKEVEKLNETKESLQRRFDVGKGNGQGIEEIVDEWLISTIDEAGKFVEDEQKAKKKCFNWLCPNLKNRYQLSRKAVGKVKAVVELQEQGKFDEVSGVTVPKYRLHGQAEGFLAFTSRTSILDKILDALADDSVNKIGVYGKGGIGKTTLVKEVAREVKEDKLFDKVVFAEVSRTPDVKRIQGQIADQLDLKFHAESESERAMMLCDRLKEEKMLVILDNIWTGLDLERVGIPSGDDHKACKVLLTSRMLYVLSNDMGCQKNYLVSVLTKDEAWSLFQKMVGDYIDNRDLQPIAVGVASICVGWPIVIVTVATALRNKSVLEWKDALLKLSRSSLENITDVDPVVYSTIELSYNHLDDQEAKLTFLLCSLMKHPYDVPIMDLLKYAVGLGLFNDTNTMEETRDRVYSLVHKLKDSGLLCDGHTGECFSMHDVVRDVAISIASREQHVFTLQNTVVQREWTGKDILKTCTPISSHNRNIVELPEGLECPQLKLFYMNAKDSFRKMPDNFFTGRTELRVLVLTEMLLLFLPSSFHLLVNLQTLCLDQCILGDIATIGNLKKLQILSLCCSNIQHLPGEIGQLTQLRLLDLSNCPNLKVISPNVISSLSHLEELFMGNTSVEWESEGLNIDGNNANLDEFQHLCHLTRLEIHIKDAKILPKGLFSREFQRYKIFIGDVWDWFGNYDNTRTLKLKLSTNGCLEDGVIMQLKTYI
ncbi:Disease resistance protein [Melia azedarach]|uniref:Disease resistance protein n=1 Tax=Melia azedarach TaxID=155640 RepID=A0ACC1YIN5_MELAZ|nr:Disease resistance protein [Melia azedarach]